MTGGAASRVGGPAEPKHATREPLQGPRFRPLSFVFLGKGQKVPSEASGRDLWDSSDSLLPAWFPDPSPTGPG